MAENLAWIKFFVGDWRRDPKVAMLSASGRGVWLEMILTMHDLADFKIEGTIREIARMCHLDMAEVQSALQELERHEVAEVEWRNDSVTGDAIVTVVSRRLEREEKTRSDARERQKKYREKKKSQENNTIVPSDSDSDSDSNKNKKVYKAQTATYRPTKKEIEGIYRAYPRKVGKKYALAKIQEALISLYKETGQDSFSFLIERTRMFANSPAGKAGTYTPHPATWYNQGRYLDDPKEWYIQDIPDKKKPQQEQVKVSRGSFMV